MEYLLMFVLCVLFAAVMNSLQMRRMGLSGIRVFFSFNNLRKLIRVFTKKDKKRRVYDYSKTAN